MKAIYLALAALLAVPAVNASARWLTPFERSQGTETATYHEAISFYRQLAKRYKTIHIETAGMTDSGEPLHLVLYSAHSRFAVDNARAKGDTVYLINNAIHPGEPDGVDASMMLLRDLAAGNVALPAEKQGVLLAVIPVYNIGGALNRNSTTRTNQNGPLLYGFRGNGRNYDLNRDFIKMDTNNARAFARLFHRLDPDVLIDTHVSNGADYQHVMTLIDTQSDKLGEPLGGYLRETMLPALYAAMEAQSFSMVPYVNVHGTIPDKGWDQFFDWPRYSSGYASLFQSVGMISEAHMLKPYRQRVDATYALLLNTLRYLYIHGEQLQQKRARQRASVKTQRRYALDWEVDRERPRYIQFKGYEAGKPTSVVTGLPRLSYDRERPFSKRIPIYERFKPTLTVEAPAAYILSQAWSDVIERLKVNGVRLQTLKRSAELSVEVYYIDSYETSKEPYEGHYPHSQVRVRRQRMKLAFRAGDYVVPMDQVANRYIVQTLEPQARDSFFAWNFFDTVLQRKEYYSAYIFEDRAAAILASNTDLNQQFEKKKSEDAEFAGNSGAQLDFIYAQSRHSEAEYRRYPVYRIQDVAKIEQLLRAVPLVESPG